MGITNRRARSAAESWHAGSGAEATRPIRAAANWSVCRYRGAFLLAAFGVQREGGPSSPFYDSSYRHPAMTLADRLAGDQRKAMLAGDSLRVSTIRLARASIHNAAIERGRDLTDAEVVEALGREMKRRREAIEALAKGGGDDLVRRGTPAPAIPREYFSGPPAPAELRALFPQRATQSPP